jgi:hypothetical protein
MRKALETLALQVVVGELLDGKVMALDRLNHQLALDLLHVLHDLRELDNACLRYLLALGLSITSVDFQLFSQCPGSSWWLTLTGNQRFRHELISLSLGMTLEGVGEQHVLPRWADFFQTIPLQTVCPIRRQHLRQKRQRLLNARTIITEFPSLSFLDLRHGTPIFEMSDLKVLQKALPQLKGLALPDTTATDVLCHLPLSFPYLQTLHAPTLLTLTDAVVQHWGQLQLPSSSSSSSSSSGAAFGRKSCRLRIAVLPLASITASHMAHFMELLPRIHLFAHLQSLTLHGGGFRSCHQLLDMLIDMEQLQSLTLQSLSLYQASNVADTPNALDGSRHTECDGPEQTATSNSLQHFCAEDSNITTDWLMALCQRTPQLASFCLKACTLRSQSGGSGEDAASGRKVDDHREETLGESMPMSRELLSSPLSWGYFPYLQEVTIDDCQSSEPQIIASIYSGLNQTQTQNQNQSASSPSSLG